MKKAALKVAAPKVAVPSKRTPEVEAIIEQCIAEGIPLRQICREPGMPSWFSVYQWMNSDPEFASRIARARETGFDAIAADSLAIVDAQPERNQFGGIDSGSVAHAKLRAEHRLKLLAKWSPKRYGDKVENVHTGPDGGPVALSLKVSFVNGS